MRIVFTWLRNGIVLNERQLVLGVLQSIEETRRLNTNTCSYLAGESPYPGKNARQVADLLQAGYRMPRPRHLAKDL